MSKSIKPVGHLLASLLVAAGAVGATVEAACGSDIKPDSDTTFQKPKDSQFVVHAAPEGAHLLCVPALTPNKSAWLTIVGSHDEPLSRVSLLVNGQPVDSNASGQAVFTVPNAGAVSLCLSSVTGARVDEKDFALLPDGILCLASAAPAVGKLIPPPAPAWPALLFAPAFIQPGSTLVLLGSGFEARPQSDHPFLDGVPLETLSASGNALLVKVPDNLGIGPFKQLLVATKYGDTPEVETDIARAQLELPDAAESRGDLAGRIVVYGTALPTLVSVHVPAGASLSTSASAGQNVGDQDLLVLPGGALSFQPVTVTRKSKRSPLPTVSLLPDAPYLNGSSQTPSTSLLQTLDYAILIKLKRRDLALQSRLQELRLLSPPANPNQSTSQIEKSASELRALSMRHNSTAMMLAARQALLTAHGGTQAQIQQALDDASGGAYYLLESKVRSLAVVPVTEVVPGAEPVPKPRANDIFLPEVHFKLWPPPEDAQTSAALHLTPLAVPAKTAATQPAPKDFLTTQPGKVQPAPADSKQMPKPIPGPKLPDATGSTAGAAGKQTTAKSDVAGAVRKAGPSASKRTSGQSGTGTASRNSAHKHHRRKWPGN